MSKQAQHSQAQEHTPTKVTAYQLSAPCNYGATKFELQSAVDGHKIAIVDNLNLARRIVACVNACEGITIEALEATDASLTFFMDCVAERDRLLATQKELVEALTKLVLSLDWEEQRSGTTYNGIDGAHAVLAKLS